MALPLIAAAGIKLFALIPILLGSLGLLVMKALFVGKIALLLAGVLAFQRLFGSSNSGATSFFSKNPQPSTGWFDNANQGWAANVAAGVQPQGYYKRSFDAENGKIDAHSMAYSAQAPITNETNWNEDPESTFMRNERLQATWGPYLSNLVRVILARLILDC